MRTYWEKIIQFRLISVQILKKSLIAKLFTIKKILKTKIKSYDDEATDVHNREISKTGSDYTSLAEIKVDSAL